MPVPGGVQRSKAKVIARNARVQSGGTVKDAYPTSMFRGFREYLAGLLAPRDRNKTLTALAGAEPVTGAQHPAVQRLQFFLSESRWDYERVNARRLDLLVTDPATAPHGGGVPARDS